MNETALKFYESARQETLLRIRLRDHILLVYLAAAGTILGISLGDINNKEVSLVVPFIALGASILLCQHNLAIGFIGKYCVDEVGDFIKSLNPSQKIEHWDNSIAFKGHSKTSMRLRTWGQSLILLIPCFLSLSNNYKHIFSPFPFGICWWFGLLSVILVIVVAIYTHFVRIELYRDRWPKN